MPLITFTSDFGTADSYVGEVKGVLLSLVPGVTVVDLTHHVSPGDVRAAAYVLGRAWRRFPAGTVHLIVVDPGVGTARSALACGAGGHFFVAPDNGILTPILKDGGAEVVRLTVPEDAAPTFHGRDVFAPAAARLASGAPLGKLGPPYAEAVRLEYLDPFYEGKSVVGEVLYVDRFGNLVSNLTTEEVPSYAVLEVDETVIGPLRRTFGDAAAGELVAYLGSGGTVEIAVRGGSAARLLGLGVGGRVRARLG